MFGSLDCIRHLRRGPRVSLVVEPGIGFGSLRLLADSVHYSSKDELWPQCYADGFHIASRFDLAGTLGLEATTSILCCGLSWTELAGSTFSFR